MQSHKPRRLYKLYRPGQYPATAKQRPIHIGGTIDDVSRDQFGLCRPKRNSSLAERANAMPMCDVFRQGTHVIVVDESIDTLAALVVMEHRLEGCNFDYGTDKELRLQLIAVAVRHGAPRMGDLADQLDRRGTLSQKYQFVKNYLINGVWDDDEPIDEYEDPLEGAIDQPWMTDPATERERRDRSTVDRRADQDDE